MRSVTAIILLVVLLPSCALAGKIYGIIKEGGRPVRQGLNVEITGVSDTLKVVAHAQTDKDGLYRLYVKGTGKCNLTVRDTLRHEGDTLSIPIRSYRKSVRYNLLIQRDTLGNYILKRE